MKVAIILATGFEEIEAVGIIDILKRGGIDCVSVGLDRRKVTGAHNITVYADIVLDDLLVSEYEMAILPGGLPGADNLANSNKLCEILQSFDANNKHIGAICAAPFVLAKFDLIKNSYTCYPGFEKNVNKSGYISNQNVVRDHNIMTSRGPATAMEFGLEILRELKGEKVYLDVKNGLLFE